MVELHLPQSRKEIILQTIYLLCLPLPHIIIFPMESKKNKATFFNFSSLKYGLKAVYFFDAISIGSRSFTMKYYDQSRLPQIKS